LRWIVVLAVELADAPLGTAAHHIFKGAGIVAAFKVFNRWKQGINKKENKNEKRIYRG
jgi:hypothetical protein